MTTWTDTAFISGHPSLDFVNTAGGRTKDRDVERLVGFDVAAGWAHEVGILDDSELHELLANSAADPETAARALMELRAQREALHMFLLNAIEGVECESAVRERVTSDITTAYLGAHLSSRLQDQHAWVVTLAELGPRVVARRLALATGALLAGNQRSQISVCGRCSWMFLDPSPTKRRRWCSMTTCGNRAKAQRQQHR